LLISQILTLHLRLATESIIMVVLKRQVHHLVMQEQASHTLTLVLATNIKSKGFPHISYLRQIR